MDDYAAQVEEVEALKAIYDADFSSNRGAHAIRIQSDVGVAASNSEFSLKLQLIFPEDYPSGSAPVYELKAPWLDPSEVSHIADNLNRIYSENHGEVVVYQWVEWIREYITSKAAEIHSDQEEPATPQNELHTAEEELLKDEQETAQSGMNFSSKVEATVNRLFPDKEVGTQCPTIVHGEPRTDRKSTFQAHVAAVTTVKEVEAVLTELKSNRKIATATHNILAYRLYDGSRGVFMQDYDDDGEAAAGGRLLHLLQIMDIQNAMVVVTRWFGGILLHSDRFKHINNVARILLQETGFGQEHKDVKDSEKKKSKPGKRR